MASIIANPPVYVSVPPPLQNADKVPLPARVDVAPPVPLIPPPLDQPICNSFPCVTDITVCFSSYTFVDKEQQNHMLC